MSRTRNNLKQTTTDRKNGLKHKRTTVSLLLAVLCSLTFGHAFSQTVDTIYHNGTILTMAGDPALMELESDLAKVLASVDAFKVR
jgi:cation transporter-like permease